MALCQKTFDASVAGLLAQGRYSMDSGGDSCAYRGVGHVKCAAGHLISDEEYNRNLEGLSVDDQDVRGAVIASGFCPDTASALQEIHDTFAKSKRFDFHPGPWPEFIGALKAFAAANKLSWNQPA